MALNRFTGANDGDVADATTYTSNWQEVQDSLEDIGSCIISGCTISAGVGLTVAVAAGVASLGGRLTVAGFNITGLADNTTNHLYLKIDGTGTSNTTGTAPADTIKLGTAITLAGAVSSVAQTWAAGRQTRRRTEDLIHGSGAGHPRAVDLAQWHATNNEGNEVKGTIPAGALPSSFTAPATFTNDDATGSGTTYPLRVRHTNSGGAGANGIGAGIQFEVENTGGTVSTAGAVRFVTENDISANLTTRWEVEVYKNAAARTMMRVGPTSVRLEQQPAASADFGLLSVGGGGWAGGAGNFVGSASGCLLALNMDAGYAGDWINVQSDSAEYFKVGSTGAATHTVWDTTGNNVSAALTLRHLSNAGAGAANIGTRLEWQAESSTNDSADVAGQIDCVLTTATHSSATSRMDLRVNNAGTMTNPVSLSPTIAAFNVQLQGNGQGLAYGRAQVTFSSDADYTLLAAEYQCPILDVQTGVITAPRNLIVPATLGAIWLVRNQNAQSVTVKTPAGTGITIATGKTAFVFCGGANILRASADV
jgi:hypothetical protein